MDNQTTGPDASGDAAPDYAAKYNGLQAAFQKRTNEFATREQAWEAERSEFEAKMARLAEYEARDQAEREEREAVEQYNALRGRFEPEPPTPGRHNGAARSIAGNRSRDDGSPEYAYGELSKALGTVVKSDSWG